MVNFYFECALAEREPRRSLWGGGGGEGTNKKERERIFNKV